MSGENTGMPAVLWNVSQNLSDSEKEQARTNIGVDRSVTLLDGSSVTFSTLQAAFDSGKYPIICFTVGSGKYLLPYVVTDTYISCIDPADINGNWFEYGWGTGNVKGKRPLGKQRINFYTTVGIDSEKKVATIYRDGIVANGELANRIMFSLYIKNVSATTQQARLVNDATDADAPAGYNYTCWSNKEYTKTAQAPVNACSSGTIGTDWDAGGSISGGSWYTLGPGETSALTSTVLVTNSTDIKRGIFKIFIARITDTDKFFGYIEEQ